VLLDLLAGLADLDDPLHEHSGGVDVLGKLAADAS